MRLIERENIQKPIAFCLILLTVLSLTGNTLIVSYAQEEDYENLAVLLNNVRSARYRFSIPNATVTIGLRILGDDTVGGEATWRVEWETVEEGGEPSTIMLWISKSTGRCIQAEIEGVTYTGVLAEMFGGVMLMVWFAWVGAYSEIWNYTEVYNMGQLGYGTLSFLGSELQTIGPTPLTVYKYRWEGSSSAPEGYRVTSEWWYAPVSFGSIIVKLYWEFEGGWGQMELLSIELTSPQPTPTPTPTPGLGLSSEMLLIIGAVAAAAVIVVVVMLLRRKKPEPQPTYAPPPPPPPPPR